MLARYRPELLALSLSVLPQVQCLAPDLLESAFETHSRSQKESRFAYHLPSSNYSQSFDFRCRRETRGCTEGASTSIAGEVD